MQKYFYHKDGQQYGPYTKEDLILFKISRSTMIWFEGLPDWVQAQDVKELADLFKHEPPPFNDRNRSTPPPINKNQKQVQTGSKSNWIFWGLVIVITLGGLTYMLYGINHEQQVSMQNEINEHNDYIKEQERIRVAEEERRAKEARQREFNKLKRQYDQAVNRVRAEYIELDQIQEFHFLRTIEEKEQQIETQLSVIRSWENEVQRLKNILNQY